MSNVINICDMYFGNDDEDTSPREPQHVMPPAVADWSQEAIDDRLLHISA